MGKDTGFKEFERKTPAYQPVEVNYTDKELKHIQALYAGTRTYVDAWFGHFMEWITLTVLI